MPGGAVGARGRATVEHPRPLNAGLRDLVLGVGRQQLVAVRALQELPARLLDPDSRSGWARGFVGGTEFPKVPVGPERPQSCNMSHVTILQHDCAVCAAKYGKLVRLVHLEIMFYVQNLEPGSRSGPFEYSKRRVRFVPVVHNKPLKL